MIQISGRNPIRGFLCGVTSIIDGLISVLSLGLLHSRFAFNFVGWWEITSIKRKMRRNSR